MFDRRPTIASAQGMVAAAHPLAALAGARMLVEGGNAFDAVVATAAALNVVEPYMSGLAGMGVATFYSAADETVGCLDFVTPIPRRFDAPSRRRPELLRGPHGIGTPGNLAGWCALLDARGRLDRARVFAPAIRLARDGFPLTENNAVFIRSALPELGGFADWRANYLQPLGGEPARGRLLRQPALAETYEAIVADGPGYLYGGPLGRALVACIAGLGGCLTMEDLEAVAPVWQAPLAARFAGRDVHLPPPPGEGFQLLLTLRILDGLDLAADERDGPRHLDRVWRAIRLAADTRIRHNKPDAAALDRLLGEAAVGRLRQAVEAEAAVEGLTEMWPDPASPPAGGRDNTTSFSAADADGNMVCITQSLGSVFGSGVVVPGTGLCLNNFLNWGELNPEGPNYMAPGAALALPIAPTITLAEGAPVLALGTPGSYGICQTQAQVMVQHLVYGLPVQQAIAAPRARLWNGRVVHAESRFAPETIEALRRRGHDVTVVDPFTWVVGGMHGIARDPQTGVLEGGADPRRDGYAMPVL